MSQANQTKCQVRIDGKTVEEIKDFSYRSDALAVGDEAHFTVVNHRKRYTAALKVGQNVEFLLSNPQVNGGDWTLKHSGLITQRTHAGDSSGSSIKCTSADRGWHLMNSHAPLWFNLRKAKFIDLIDPARKFRDRRGQQIGFIDNSWGIKGYRDSGDNEISRLIKMGLPQGVAAAAANAQKVLDPVFAVQVEPGDTVYDVISTYAKRLNILISVTVDNYIQAWRPRYNRKAAYKVRNVDRGPDNNVLSFSMQEDLKSQYTEVVCVGNQIGYEGPQDPSNPNATKKRGSIYHPDLLPFLRRLTFSDSAMFRSGLAQRAAEWRYKRSLFDSWYVTYTVEGHHQDGRWYEADQIVSVEDDEAGIAGDLWCVAVDYAVSKSGGDVATLTLRKPYLLTANFGVQPSPPRIKSSSPEASASGKTSTTRPAGTP